VYVSLSRNRFLYLIVFVRKNLNSACAAEKLETFSLWQMKKFQFFPLLSSTLSLARMVKSKHETHKNFNMFLTINAAARA
jgi:hypothetical protein